MTELQQYSVPRARPHMRRRRHARRDSLSAYGSMYAELGYAEPLTIRYAAEAYDAGENAAPSMLMQILIFGTNLGRFLHIALKMMLPIAMTWMWLHMHRHKVPV